MATSIKACALKNPRRLRIRIKLRVLPKMNSKYKSSWLTRSGLECATPVALCLKHS